MPPLPHALPAFLVPAVSFWQNMGWMGVDLFFVLSGFLVSGLLYKEYSKTGDFKLWQFLARRGLKIYPSYYLFLILSLPTIMWVPGMVNPYSLGCELVFLGNTFFSMWGHTWSLCIEEHFYLILAFGFYIATRKPGRFKFFVPVCLLFLLVPLCLRFNLIFRIPFHTKPHYTATAVRLDALTFGVLLSYYYFHKPQFKIWINKHRWLLVAIGALLILPSALANREEFWQPHAFDIHQILLYTFGLTALYVGWGLILLAVVAYDVKSEHKILRVFAHIGMYSYCIYLWHKPASWLCSHPEVWGFGPLNESLVLAIYFAASLTVGILMSVCVEWPVLKIRDKWFPSRSGGTAVPPATEAGAS